MKRLTVFLSLLASCALTSVAQDITAEYVRKTTHEKLGMTVVSAQFKSDTPDWVVSETGKASALTWVQLTHKPVPNSVRYRKMAQMKKIRKARYAMWNIIWKVREHAGNNAGIGPAAISEFDWATRTQFYESPWKTGRPSAERSAAMAEAQVAAQRQQLARSKAQKFLTQEEEKHRG